jgi:hypothetical protein
VDPNQAPTHCTKNAFYNFKNSATALKEMLDSFDVPPNIDIVSCDAESMYTNIPTNAAMAELCQYLEENRE